MANFTDAQDNDCDDEVQEYELAEADVDDRGRLVLQPGKFSIHTTLLELTHVYTYKR